MDRLSPAQRRKCMQANKSKGTSIEVVLGKALWARGFRYRKHAKGVPGHPDFCFKGKKVAVFCDGEFWHGRDWEANKVRIHSNQEFWYSKIERNIARDIDITEQLHRDGWTVIRFWESDIRKHLDECVNRVEAALNGVGIARGYQMEEKWREWIAAEDEAGYELE